MMLILGQKKNTASVFKDDHRVTVTLVDITDCCVAHKIEREDDVVVQVGFGKKNNPPKPQARMYEKLKYVPQVVKEMRLTKEAAEKLEVGSSLVEQLKDVAKVSVTGKSKGKGFAGVMKRWGFSGLPATHGIKRHHRAPGSIGTQGMDRVIKGKKMAGRMGYENNTLHNKELIDVIEEEGRTFAIIRGTLPGGYNSVLQIKFDK